MELDGETILTRFVPDALILDGVSSGMVDVYVGEIFGWDADKGSELN